MRVRPAPWSCALASWLLAGTAVAQLPRLVGPTGPLSVRTGVALAVDDDDDDEDGRLDLEQTEAVPTDDLFSVRVEGTITSPLEISVTGGVRLVVRASRKSARFQSARMRNIQRNTWRRFSRRA